MRKLIANRETLIHRASELADFVRTVEIGQLHIANESVLDGKYTILISHAKNTQGQGILEIQ